VRLLSLVVASVWIQLAVLAQELNPAKLLSPGRDSWPTYNGDYSGRRFSDLKQIDASNVGSLAAHR
jgi:alcohol dehydrogenase (cytochrome c)